MSETALQATTERMLFWKTAEGHQAVEGAKSASEMLRAADLDWDVELRDIYVKDEHGSEVNGGHRKAIVRKDTSAILGVAKSRYVPFANREVFSFLDNLTDSGEALYEAAWQWRGGETVGVALRLPETVKIGGFDEHSMHLLVRTSHDGGGSLVCAATPVRIGCTNQVTAILRKAERVWKLRHTTSLEGKINEARSSLSMTFGYASAWDEAAQLLVAESVTKDKVAEVAEELFGERHVDAVVSNWMHTPNIEDFRTTRYGAYNAMTEYAQWIAPRSRPSLESALRGTVASRSARAYDLLSV
jgi:phage/plasmid-like protein (TIGR03299 family)